MFRYPVLILFIAFQYTVSAQPLKVKRVTVDRGWAKNSVNAVAFRKNSLVSFHEWQFIAFYNKDGYVVLGKRKWETNKWELRQTPYKGNTSDAHNAISIMVDGDGYLHMAWNHHNNNLHYVRSIKPGSLELTREMPMTGNLENEVSYPEFYRMPNGALLFLYRNGGSGNGNLVVNSYDLKTKTWKQLHSNLIDGEGHRNAYWQACVDSKGMIHISWVWRESAAVESNHDMAYACSKDGGITWQTSGGELYQLPIRLNNAETILHIPQGSELMNQTSMFADAESRSYIATYWIEGNDVPQYHVIYKTNDGWKTDIVSRRNTRFTLNGRGTKSVPVARPQIVTWQTKNRTLAAMIFRDSERRNKISVALNKNLGQTDWEIIDLTQTEVGSWEPTYDTELWKEKGLLHLFVQNVVQEDAEGLSGLAPQTIEVLEWNPKNL